MSAAPARVLVTGASRGLGTTFARALAARGHPLVVSARSGPALAALAEALRRAHDVEVTVVAGDLSTPGGVEAIAEAAIALGVGGLVNNAGAGLFGPFADHTPEALAALVHLDVVAPTLLCHRLLPSLRAHRGFVINLGSTAALQAIPGLAAYAASKAYILSLSEALALEVAADGVRVLAVCPGPTATAFFATAGFGEGLPPTSLSDPEEVVATALAALAAGRSAVVVGWRNRFLAGAGRLVPRAVAARMAGRMVGSLRQASPAP